MNKEEKLYQNHNKVPPDYYDKAINNNILQRFWHHQRYYQVNNYFRFNKIKPKEILDIGCHGGKFTNEVWKLFPKAKISAIDISSNAINYAKKKYPQINFINARAEKIPFNKITFDLITCFEVLEHLPNPEIVVNNIYDLLKNKGLFLIMVPSENLLFKFIWFFWTKLGPGRVWKEVHLQKYNHQKLENLLLKNNFKKISTMKFIFGMLSLISCSK